MSSTDAPTTTETTMKTRPTLALLLLLLAPLAGCSRDPVGDVNVARDGFKSPTSEYYYLDQLPNPTPEQHHRRRALAEAHKDKIAEIEQSIREAKETKQALDAFERFKSAENND